MKNLLFDINDPMTLTEAKDRSTKWNDKVTVLTDESLFGVVTVYDNSYGYGDVLDAAADSLRKMFPADAHKIGMFDHRTHCDFCGQAITYVAVIIGINRKNKNERFFRQIGCDCLGKIFGQRWYGWRNASRMRTELVNLAKKRSRQLKYAKLYTKYITWLTDVPKSVMERNYFLRGMHDVLTTGSKVFSKNMESALQRMMNDPRFSKEGVEKEQKQTSDILSRIDILLALIQDVDGVVATRPWLGKSSYEFVSSVRSNVVKWGKLTEGQKNALNNVHVRYTERKAKMEHDASVSSKLGVRSTVTIPDEPTDEIPW